MFQGRVDAGKRWNEHYDRVMSKLKVHRTTRDLVACASIVDDELVAFNVSSDEIIFCTNSITLRSKLVSHLQKKFNPKLRKDLLLIN